MKYWKPIYKDKKVQENIKTLIEYTVYKKCLKQVKLLFQTLWFLNNKFYNISLWCWIDLCNLTIKMATYLCKMIFIKLSVYGWVFNLINKKDKNSILIICKSLKYYFFQNLKNVFTIYIYFDIIKITKYLLR